MVIVCVAQETACCSRAVWDFSKSSKPLCISPVHLYENGRQQEFFITRPQFSTLRKVSYSLRLKPIILCNISEVHTSTYAKLAKHKAPSPTTNK